MATVGTPSPLDRFLRLFSDVRVGEGATALLLSANVFLLLTCYYILKPVREALILGQGSAELKSYTAAAQVLVLTVVVRLYGKLADRVPRRRLINVVTVIFAACLIGFYGLAQLAVPLGIVFYVWLGIFSVMLVAQFWAFANDVYSKEEGERLFPIVAFGASVGAALGAAIAKLLIVPIGVYQLMLVGAVLLVAQLQITNYVDRRELRLQQHPAQPAGASAAAPVSADSAETTGAFALVFRTRYLLAIGLLVLMLNFVNTTGEYILGRVVTENAQRAVAAGTAAGLSVEDYIGDFYAGFFAIVNLVGILVQLFLVSRIIKYLGVMVGILFLPVIALGAYSLIAVYPVLSYIRWAKTAENATDYSLNNTIRHALFLPATREQKYKGGQTVDSFFQRVGDVFSAVLVLVGTHLIVLETGGFATFNLAIVVVWLLLAIWIGREYRRLVTTGEVPS